MWGKTLRRAVRRRVGYARHGKGRRAGLAVGALLAAPSSLTAGPAVGQFEIKSLDAVPGRIEFQSQNAYTLGNPRRSVVEDDDEIEGDDNSVSRARAALELEYSFTRYFKTRIGIEYEKERIEDAASLDEVNDFDRLRLDEYAFEGILILIPRPKQGFALGAVVEYELPFERGGARTLNYGPIIEWVSGPWLATFNPTLIQFFGGELPTRWRWRSRAMERSSAWAAPDIRAMRRWSSATSTSTASALSPTSPSSRAKPTSCAKVTRRR